MSLLRSGKVGQMPISPSNQAPERIRNPKYAIARLTAEDWEREQKCWEETNLQILRARGVETGLTEYMNEIEARLVPIVSSDTS